MNSIFRGVGFLASFFVGWHVGEFIAYVNYQDLISAMFLTATAVALFAIADQLED